MSLRDESVSDENGRRRDFAFHQSFGRIFPSVGIVFRAFAKRHADGVLSLPRPARPTR
jgi:hypothetical protein